MQRSLLTPRHQTPGFLRAHGAPKYEAMRAFDTWKTEGENALTHTHSLPPTHRGPPVQLPPRLRRPLPRPLLLLPLLQGRCLHGIQHQHQELMRVFLLAKSHRPPQPPHMLHQGSGAQQGSPAAAAATQEVHALCQTLKLAEDAPCAACCPATCGIVA